MMNSNSRSIRVAGIDMITHILTETYNRYMKDRNVTIISKEELGVIEMALINICIENGTDIRISPNAGIQQDSIYSESLNSVWINDIAIEISLAKVADIKFCYIKVDTINPVSFTSVVDDELC